MVNVGPTKEGIIPHIFRERLLQLGEWLKVNGEAIYGTSPWYHQQDSYNPNVWYTCKKKTYDHLRVSYIPSSYDQIQAVYAIFLKWPENGILKFNNTDYHTKNNNDYKIYFLKSVNSNVAMVKLNVSIRKVS